MKACAYFQKRTHPAGNFCIAGSWFCDARKHLQQCTFARPIVADNADHFTLLDSERNILKSPKNIVVLTGAIGSSKQRGHPSNDLVTQRVILALFRTNLVLFKQVLHSDSDV